MPTAAKLVVASAGMVGEAIPLLCAELVRGDSVPRAPKVRWPQQAIRGAFLGLFPPEVFKGFVFPFVEDLVNAFPFTAYHEWREGVGLSTDVPLGPLVSSRLALRIGRYGEGIQQGAFSSSSALPPLVSFGLS